MFGAIFDALSRCAVTMRWHDVLWWLDALYFFAPQGLEQAFSAAFWHARRGVMYGQNVYVLTICNHVHERRRNSFRVSFTYLAFRMRCASFCTTLLVSTPGRLQPQHERVLPFLRVPQRARRCYPFTCAAYTSPKLQVFPATCSERQPAQKNHSPGAAPSTAGPLS